MTTVTLLLRLFWEFFKTGLFSVGGGMATLPFLYRMAESTGWFTAAQLADMVAVSESTPGPIGVNMATYVGFTTAGIHGSVVATLGLITPSVIVILLIARVLQRFRSNQYVDAAFYGLRPCSVGLIGAAGLLVAKITFLHSDTAATAATDATAAITTAASTTAASTSAISSAASTSTAAMASAVTSAATDPIASAAASTASAASSLVPAALQRILALFNWKALCLAAVLLILTRYVKPVKKLHPVFFILASALVGIVFSF